MSAPERAGATQPCTLAGPPSDHNGAGEKTAGPPMQPRNGAAQGEPAVHGDLLQNGAPAPLDGSQEVEQLLRRANEIRRELPPAFSKPWEEPAQPLSHWDHLLREAVWMADDFGQERRWKRVAAWVVASEAAALGAKWWEKLREVSGEVSREAPFLRQRARDYALQERAQAMEERKRELVESGKESGTSGDDHVNRHRGMLGGAKPPLT